MNVELNLKEEENRLFLSVLEPLIKLRKETDGEIKDKLGDLYQKFLDIINGKRYKKVDIEPIVNIMVPALDEISSMVKTSKTEEIVKLIDETIKKLDSKDKPEISKKEKTAVLVTGDISFPVTIHVIIYFFFFYVVRIFF